MANWYGTSRTNYFKVKDTDAFKGFVSQFSGVKLWDGPDGAFALGADSGSDGYWPSEFPDDGSGEDIDFIDAVSEHLADGEIAVFVTSGAEKLRYVTGYAIAVRNDGERLQVSIDDIYELVMSEWGVQTTEAAY
jgi:hypothetical protein